VATRPTASISRPTEPMQAPDASALEVLSEAVFHRRIAQERKRSERSQRPFVLLLIDAGRISRRTARGLSC
jgi:hypothetical protein